MPAQKISVNEKHSLNIFSDMEPKGISASFFQPQLKSADVDSTETIVQKSESQVSGLDENEEQSEKVTSAQWVTVFILCYVNLINYMDRYTIAGILPEVKTSFSIGDDKGGLLQTAFVVSYMLFAPLFGYMGDRYNRTLIMAAGVFLWSLTTLVGSFMNSYYWFLFFRMLVGIGEASYSTIAPTIISDLFAKNLRSKMLAAFYFAIPVGSGLGYIVGSETATAFGSWHWGLRVTPIAGTIAVLLILFVLEDPPRGQSEGRTHLQPTSWTNDLKVLIKNRSFMLSTGGFTCVAFVTGALAWWGPNYIYYGLVLQPGYETVKLSSVAYVFGILSMGSGLLGVPTGMWLSQRLRPKYEQADPIICAMGLLLSAPFIFFAMWMASINIVLCYVFVFIGELCLNLNWSIVADILLYVVSPTRRSTAEAFQILVSHAFGDAGSPYLIGVLSEAFKRMLNPSTAAALASGAIMYGTTTTASPSPEVLFRSLQYSLFMTCFVEVLGGIFFLLTAVYVVHDKKAAERGLHGVENPAASNNDLYSDTSDIDVVSSGKQSSV